MTSADADLARRSRPGPTRGPVRLLRGAVVGGAGTAVSLLSHVAAGGALAEPALVVASALSATALGWWLSHARWSATRLLGVLLVVQSALHLLWSPHPGHAGGSALLMLTAHAGASAVALLLLVGGERWLWDLLDTLALRVARLVRQVPVPATGRVGVASPRPQLAAPARVLLPRRRGPPIVLAAR